MRVENTPADPSGPESPMPGGLRSSWARGGPQRTLASPSVSNAVHRTTGEGRAGRWGCRLGRKPSEPTACAHHHRGHPRGTNGLETQRMQPIMSSMTLGTHMAGPSADAPPWSPGSCGGPTAELVWAAWVHSDQHPLCRGLLPPQSSASAGPEFKAGLSSVRGQPVGTRTRMWGRGRGSAWSPAITVHAAVTATWAAAEPTG